MKENVGTEMSKLIDRVSIKKQHEIRIATKISKRKYQQTKRKFEREKQLQYTIHCPKNKADFREYKGGSPWRENFPVIRGNDD